MTTDQFAHIALAVITPSLTNPRKNFNAAKLTELAASIAASGVHQPVLLRPLPGARVADTDRKVEYELVCGERRYRASLEAAVATIPAMIRALTDDQVLEIQIVENLQRDDLSELEEAEGFQALMQHAGLNAEQVGAKIGKSRAHVYARLKLLDLDMEVKQAMRDGKIDASRGVLIARIPDSKLQLKALAYATTPQGYPADNPSVRLLQNWLKDNVMLKLEHAIFDIKDSRLVKDVGNCTTCPKRTGANPDLFVDVGSADICTDPACYHSKEQAHRNQMFKRAEAKGMRVVQGKEALELLNGNQWLSEPDDYRDLDEKRPDLSQDGDNVKTLGEILGKEAPDPILFIHPRTQEMVEMVPADRTTAVLLSKGISEPADDEVDDDDDVAPALELETLQKRAALKTEHLVHRGIFDACADQVKALDDKASIKLLANGDLLRAILLTKLDSYDIDEEALADALGYTFAEGEDERDGLAMNIRATTTGNLCRALVICELQADYHHSPDTVPMLIPVLLKELEVDTKAISKEAKASAKAEYSDRIKVLQAKIEAKKAPPPTAPLAQPQPTGGDKPKGAKAPAKKAPAARAKLSAEEALSGIATAMQGVDRAASAPDGAVAPPEASKGETQAPVSFAEQAAANRQLVGIGLALGQRVRIDAGKLKGKEGDVVKDLGSDCYSVKVKGRSVPTSVNMSQLTVLEGAAA